MGLDMYAGARVAGETETEEFAYWRKHNALHAFMDDRFREKGGGDDFNCVDLVLSTRDIDRLETAINGRTLKPTSGFFFGDTNYTDEDWEYHKKGDLAFIEKAREAHTKGLEVVYHAWY